MKRDMKSLMESWVRFSVEIQKEEILLERSVNSILGDKSTREVFYQEYLLTLKEGQKVTEEGFKDFVSKAKDKAVAAAKKVKNVAKGIADIGFLGRGSTLLGGEETFDIEKRKEKISDAKVVLEFEIDELTKQFAAAGINMPVDFQNLYKSLNAVDFPNNINNADFKTSLQQIEDSHTKIVDAWNNKEFDSKTANAAISVLRHMVNFFQDYKIADKYLYINEQEVKSIDSSAITGKSMDDKSANVMAAYGKKLPAGLIVAGASMIGANIVAGSDLYKTLFDSIEGGSLDVANATPEQATKKVADAITFHVEKGQGITQAVKSMTGVAMDPKAPISNFWDPKVVPLHAGIKEAIMQEATREGNAKQAVAAWNDFLAMAKSDGKKTMGEVLKGAMSGTGKSPIDLFDIKPGNYFVKSVVEGATAAGTKAAAMVAKTGGKMAAIGGIKAALGVGLLDMGIGLVAGGATSALMRAKGKRSSRMASLDNLYKLLVDVGNKTAKDELEQQNEPEEVSKEDVADAIAEIPPSEDGQNRAANQLVNVDKENEKKLISLEREVVKALQLGKEEEALAIIKNAIDTFGIPKDKIKTVIQAIISPELLQGLQKSPEVKQLTAPSADQDKQKDTEGTESLMDSFRKKLLDSGSSELQDLINSEQGKEFVDELEKYSKDNDVQYIIFEQNEQEEQIYIIEKIKVLTKDNIDLKVELLQLVLDWAKENSINAQDIDNELTGLLSQIDRPEEPPEDEEAQQKPSKDQETLAISDRINSPFVYATEKPKYLTFMANLGAHKPTANKVLDFLYANKLLAQAPVQKDNKKVRNESKQIEGEHSSVVLAQTLTGKEKWKDALSISYIVVIIKSLESKLFLKRQNIERVLEILFNNKKLYLPRTQQDYKKLRMPKYKEKVTKDKEPAKEPEQVLSSEKISESLNRMKKLAGIIK